MAVDAMNPFSLGALLSPDTIWQPTYGRFLFTEYEMDF
jgi:hypothetical protein